MYSAIEYDGATGGGIAGKDHLFYTWLIERQGNKYCYVIAMRPPFTGELFDCPGEAISGTLGYEPGALTQKQVAQQMCGRFAAERHTRCEHNVVYPVTSVFERDANSKGRYRVTVERSTSIDLARAGRSPHDYRESRVYLVSVDGRNMEEVSRTWRECFPNSGCPSLPGPPSGEE